MQGRLTANSKGIQNSLERVEAEFQRVMTFTAGLTKFVYDVTNDYLSENEEERKTIS